ncbi:hypothetical protein FDA94_23830 [Herbidospora galbida]|uniref:Uncharacterized protein n=1 Tax=Herbidospora galbida TaxID=2575442 RepID=A0A4U3MBA9_9ACTN|nr:hypothetical protein [Herbidospora galbida]TKK85930.1 hypothetical protein FDA94_23830 [Herbidospora galbida]
MRWTLRITSALHLAGVLGQALLAGLFVTGDADLLSSHEGNAGVTHSLLYVQLVVAFLFWRRRRVAWPLWATAGLVAAETLQIWAGIERNLGVHFPLGMAIFGGSAVVTLALWKVTR